MPSFFQNKLLKFNQNLFGLIFFGLIAFPFVPIFLFTKSWLRTNLPQSVKISALILAVLVASILSYHQILSFFQSVPPEASSTLHYYILYRITDSFHFVLFVLMFYAFYRIIRYKFTPYSLFYIGFYNLLHAAYDACPITGLQNYFLTGAGLEGQNNVFWLGAFGDYSLIARAAFIIMSVLVLSASYKQYLKLEIPTEDWFKFWKEKHYSKINSKDESPQTV